MLDLSVIIIFLSTRPLSFICLSIFIILNWITCFIYSSLLAWSEHKISFLLNKIQIAFCLFACMYTIETNVNYHLKMRIFFFNFSKFFFSYVNNVLYEKEIWYPFQNILIADERLFEHQGNISVINTFDLHMIK